MNRATTFFNSFYQNNPFQGNGRPLKIRLLQPYEVRWIHDIDAISIVWCDFLPAKKQSKNDRYPISILIMQCSKYRLA